MTNPALDRTVKLMTDEDRQSLRDAQRAWSSPEMVALFPNGTSKRKY